MAPGAPADLAAQEKIRKMHAVFGKFMGHMTEGGLKRAVRFAGRAPEDMDDDEKGLVRDGWEELGKKWFGDRELSPWGKVAMGTVCAGAGMYMAGKPLPPPKEIKAPEGK